MTTSPRTAGHWRTNTRSLARPQASDPIAPTIAFDLLVGSQINHILATGRPPTPEVTEQMTQIILAGLRAPA